MPKPSEITDNQKHSRIIDEEHLLRLLIDNMPDLIYIKDTRSRFILANRKLAEVHNLKSPDMLTGKSDHDLYPAELADKYYRDDQEIMTTGKPMINQEETGLDEKGNEIYLSTTKIPLKNKHGKLIGLVGMGRDITHHIRAETRLVERSEELQKMNKLLEEKQHEVKQQSEELKTQTENLTLANRELEKLSAAVSETDNVVIILDAKGNFEWVNKSFTRVYGMTMDQWIREKGRSILESSHNPYIQDILDKCRESGKTIRYQAEARDKDGNILWTQSTLTPVQDESGKIMQFISIDSDITALKKAQDLINQQRSELESQRDQLEKANITKDKFFSIIAHDLKNPFHSILGFTDLLIKRFSEIEEDKKREYLSLIHESAHFAQDLLDNLLNWSRTQSGSIKYNPSKFDLNELVEEIIRILQINLEKKSLVFRNKLQEGILVNADRNMIHTVLRNLLSNAIKYTPEKGAITIESSFLKSRIEIIVRDSGIGIPEGDQKKLFHFGEFHSSPGTAGEQGTGLGLIICNDFIKKHGGKLTFQSSVGEGTVFRFDLPVK